MCSSDLFYSMAFGLPFTFLYPTIYRRGAGNVFGTYADELRGAIVVELDSLGAGSLSFVEEESTFLRVKPSSRMKRYMQKASRASGVKAGAVSLSSFDSACAVAVRRGILGMHLVGADGAAAALSSSSQDVFENIDEAKLEEAADFVAEFVKSV